MLTPNNKANTLLIKVRHKKADLSKPSLLLWAMGGKSAKYEEIADLLNKAANLFKTVKDWTNAGNAYAEAATYYLKTPFNGHAEAAPCYVKAAMCFLKDDPLAAVDMFQHAVEIFKSDGSLMMVAKYQKEIAQILESREDFISAMKYFESAAEIFEKEGSPFLANTCYLKVGHLAAQHQSVDKAVFTFEKILQSSSTTTWMARETFVKVGLCLLCAGDTTATKKVIEKWVKILPILLGSREYIFLEDIVSMYENLDPEGFQKVVSDNAAILVDTWKQTLIGKILEQFMEDLR